MPRLWKFSQTLSNKFIKLYYGILKSPLIVISGRYNKYSRELPQTPWILDGVKIMPTSVEELMLEHLNNAFKFDGKKCQTIYILKLNIIFFNTCSINILLFELQQPNLAHQGEKTLTYELQVEGVLSCLKQLILGKSILRQMSYPRFRTTSIQDQRTFALGTYRLLKSK